MISKIQDFHCFWFGVHRVLRVLGCVHQTSIKNHYSLVCQLLLIVLKDIRRLFLIFKRNIFLFGKRFKFPKILEKLFGYNFKNIGKIVWLQFQKYWKNCSVTIPKILEKLFSSRNRCSNTVFSLSRVTTVPISSRNRIHRSDSQPSHSSSSSLISSRNQHHHLPQSESQPTDHLTRNFRSESQPSSRVIFIATAVSTPFNILVLESQHHHQHHKSQSRSRFITVPFRVATAVFRVATVNLQLYHHQRSILGSTLLVIIVHLHIIRYHLQHHTPPTSVIFNFD
ncbi:hypothetical protein HanRHA438_Chr11g0488211 [Helianthus annuus]|nr:hypothetical protein HanRHA438_Chr11g0488211 [Helianthus annuus]